MAATCARQLHVLLFIQQNQTTDQNPFTDHKVSEMEITRQSFFSQTKLLSCSTTSLSPLPPPPSIFRSKASLLVSSNSVPFHSSRTLLTQLQGLRIKAKKHRNLGAISASEADSSSTTTTTSTDVAAERWLLQPVGNIYIYIYIPLISLKFCLYSLFFFFGSFFSDSSCMQLRNKNVSGAMFELRVQLCHFH